MSIREKVEQEMQMYIQEASPSVDVNVLQWWKKISNRFSAIAEIAQTQLRVEETSTPSEWSPYSL